CRTTDQEVVQECQRLVDRGNSCFNRRSQFAQLYAANQQTRVAEDVLESLNLSEEYLDISNQAQQVCERLPKKLELLQERHHALQTAIAAIKGDTPRNRAARDQMLLLSQQMTEVREHAHNVTMPQLGFVKNFIYHNQNYFLLQHKHALVQRCYASIIEQAEFDFTRLTDTDLERLGLLSNYDNTLSSLANDLNKLQQSIASVSRDMRLVNNVHNLVTNLIPKLRHLSAHTAFFALRNYHSCVLRRYGNILDDNNFHPERLHLNGDYTAIIDYYSGLSHELEQLVQKQRAVPQATLRATVSPTVDGLRAKLMIIQNSDRYNKAVIRLKTTEAAYAAGKTGELLYQTFKPKNKHQDDDPDAAANAEAQARRDAHNRDAAIRAAAELAGIAAAASYTNPSQHRK
ncbi:MAG TPA: hypothetical protein VJJ83_04455, partial [Candidatus Babeliales bacterium]|nr:hypothetical protein [Candidatus Babeliales bacterium]